MRVTITGAGGLIGRRLVARLHERGDEVTILSRAGRDGRIAWDPMSGPAPADALAGRDGVVHLAGEPVAQRWSADAKRRIRESRDTGTRNLVAGMLAAVPAPAVLVSASAVGYYGAHGDEELTEDTPPGEDFLAEVCVAWERAALDAGDAGVRVVTPRTGVVLDAAGGALATMLPPFRLGVGGPVAGGRQWIPWIHADDLVGLYLAALDGGPAWSGAINATAPSPVTNRDFARALGRALRRPAIAPVPRLAIRALYGEMGQIVLDGQRAVPARALELGFDFGHRELEPALRDVLAG